MNYGSVQFSFSDSCGWFPCMTVSWDKFRHHTINAWLGFQGVAPIKVTFLAGEGRISHIVSVRRHQWLHMYRY